ncbi:MAG TPA: hypothetical protein VLK29_11610 [Luteimonas sp.]|nr:hypothetical protein [Luteimonas sp.]
MPMRQLLLPGLLLVALVAAACQPRGPSDTGAAASDRPAQAVLLLTRHLRDDDLAAFARAAVPPALHAQLVVAWRNGSRWPLEELPVHQRLPDILATLSRPGAEAALRGTFEREFAGADAEIRAASTALGQFGVQYLQGDNRYSTAEREHYAQLMTAASVWAARAPLSDRTRAARAIARLARAARATRLRSDADLARAGMTGSLRQLQPFVTTLKAVLADYGLRLDRDLAAMQATLQVQTGDRAQVRLRYQFAGTPIDALVDLERHDGRWYLSDFMRHAEAAVAAAGRAPAATGNARRPRADGGRAG